MAKEAKFVRLAATIEWAFLNRTNEYSGKYEFDACNLAPKAVEALEAMGIEVKVSEKRPEKGHYIKCRSSRPIKAVDEDGDPVDGEIVGNGTKAILTIGSYEWKFKGKKGISPTCRKFIVTELVEYDGGDPDEDEIEDAL
jgi:hypothetical protein